MVRYNYKELLDKDPNFKKWYENIRRGSPASADGKLRRVGYVCRVFCTCGHAQEEHEKGCKKCSCKGFANVTTKKMAVMNAKKGVSLILDVISKLESEGKEGEYIKDYVKALKSWFEWNATHITQKIKVPRPSGNSKKSLEQSPTPDQFRRVLNTSDPKEKVECTAVGYSGLRIETLGDYLGKDGLKVKDLPEMEVDNKAKSVEFKKIPTMVVVRPNLSKAGHQYFTFAPDEECEYLKDLLERRMRNGEELAPDSPIVVSLRYHDAMQNEHIRTGNISDSMRVPIREAGFDWRPYILRSYFDTRMMMAEADGLIIRDWRVFWMGHKGDIEHVYTLNKKLPDDLVEKMREAFARAAGKYVVTSIRREGVSQDAMKAQFNRQILEVWGYSTQELDTMGDLSTLSPADVNKLIQEKSKRALGLNGNNQKVVPIAEVKEWITQGWEYVTNLPTDEAVIRLPQ